MYSEQGKSKFKQSSNKKILKRGSIDTIYVQIKTMMYNHELAPGQKLILKDLAKRLQISTTPLLQALHRLQTAKLARYEKNKGFFVAEITETEARELYQAREALEVFLAPIISEKVTKADIQRIINSYRAKTDKTQHNYPRKLMLTDAEFHLTIAKLSGNQVIVELLESVLECIYLKYQADYLSEERISSVLNEHRKILNAFSEKNSEEVIQLLREHIRSGMEEMIYNLSNGRVNSL